MDNSDDEVSFVDENGITHTYTNNMEDKKSSKWSSLLDKKQ